MIRAAFSSLAGAWIAKNVQKGDIPESFAVPLTFLAARISTPVLLAGAIGFGLYRWNQQARAMAAKDVTPPSTQNPSARAKRPAAQRRRQVSRKAKPTAKNDAADV